MTRVSKKQLPVELRTKAWGQLLAAIKASDSPEALKKKLGSFLTPTELTMLEKRLAIPVLVERGLSYRRIGEAIDVSPNTVSFVKYHLVRAPLRGQLAAIRKRYRPRVTPSAASS